VDIIVTKIGRLNDRDVQDIEACISRCNIKKKEIVARAANLIYVGKEEDYQYNLQWVIANLYPQ
jgi:hypothetical protein